MKELKQAIDNLSEEEWKNMHCMMNFYGYYSPYGIAKHIQEIADYAEEIGLGKYDVLDIMIAWE